jgi:hypothetical protein
VSLPEGPDALTKALAILRLLLRSAPFAILRCVRAIRVWVPIKRLSLRPLSHVLHKLLEALAPLSTDLDTPTSITVVFLMILVSTSLDHVAETGVRFL